jgi:hypothetical protein
MHSTQKKPYVRIVIPCLAGLLATACGVPEELEPLPPPDDGTTYAVRGMAEGVIAPVELQLRVSGATESVTVTEDGAFAFATRLRRGTAYNVEVAGEQPCVFENEGGLAGPDMPRVDAICGGVMLAELVLVGPGMPSVELVPEQTTYSVDVSVLQQSVRVLATAMSPDSLVTVAGERVNAGEPSEPIAIGFPGGEGSIEVTVTYGSGATRAYRLDVQRVASMAQHAYAKASNPGELDMFGYSVAVSGDTMVVGAAREASSARGIGGDQDDDGAQVSGAVYVFRRDGLDWRQEAYIKASNADAGDQFGFSVALSGDTLAVGAPFEQSSATGVDGDQGNGNNGLSRGAVYVFTRGEAGWQQEAYVKASNTAFSSLFGYSVALSGDRLAVGAPGDNSNARGVNGDQQNDGASGSGAVHVFARGGDGKWQHEAYIKATNTGASDFFGASISLFGDALAVGAPQEDSSARGTNGDQEDDSARDSGAVYVFRRVLGTWLDEGYVKASNTGADDQFGYAVQMTEFLLAVGAPGEDSSARLADGPQNDENAPESGAVYVFFRGTVWEQNVYLKAPNTGSTDGFGTSLAMVGAEPSSPLLAVGAPHEDSAGSLDEDHQDNDSSVDSGAVYVFWPSTYGWKLVSVVKGDNTGPGDGLGISVALTPDTLVVGADLESSAATGVNGEPQGEDVLASGAVYVIH